ncbi:hypothetical protein [Rhodanobacter sp. OR444]|nr:hypothetical protein [Rhodanobacter sp. OR444]
MARPVATHRTIKDWLESRKDDLVVMAMAAGLFVLMIFALPYCC